jgi:TPR repeat protein
MTVQPRRSYRPFVKARRDRRRNRWLAAIGLLLGLAAASAQADPEADYRLGFKAYQEDDLVVAMSSLERAAEAGHPQAQALLGYIFDKAEDNAAAVRYYRMAADQGNAEGAYWLAALYANGEGVPKDYSEAFRWFLVAAEAGYGPAIDVVSNAYLNGELGQTRDRAKAKQWLQRGADSGYEPAKTKLEQLADPEGEV